MTTAMKLKMFGAAVLIAAFGVQAAEEITLHTVCKQASETGAVIMQARQMGLPLAKQIEDAKHNHLLLTLVLEAYSLPRFNNKKIQADMINDFRDEAYLICIDQNGGAY